MTKKERRKLEKRFRKIIKEEIALFASELSANIRAVYINSSADNKYLNNILCEQIIGLTGQVEELNDLVSERIPKTNELITSSIECISEECCCCTNKSTIVSLNEENESDKKDENESDKKSESSKDKEVPIIKLGKNTFRIDDNTYELTTPDIRPVIKAILKYKCYWTDDVIDDITCIMLLKDENEKAYYKIFVKDVECFTKRNTFIFKADSYNKIKTMFDTFKLMRLD